MGEQRQAPVALTKGKRPCVHCTGIWVVLANGLDVFEKSLLLPGGRTPDRPALSPVAIPTALSQLLEGFCICYSFIAAEWNM